MSTLREFPGMAVIELLCITTGGILLTGSGNTYRKNQNLTYKLFDKRGEMIILASITERTLHVNYSIFVKKPFGHPLFVSTVDINIHHQWSWGIGTVYRRVERHHGF